MNGNGTLCVLVTKCGCRRYMVMPDDWKAGHPIMLLLREKLTVSFRESGMPLQRVRVFEATRGREQNTGAWVYEETRDE